MRGLLGRLSSPPFALKLSGAFLVVIVVGVLAVNVLTDRVVEREYVRFATAAGRAQAERVASLFLSYYAEQGSWKGLETLADRTDLQGMHRMGPGMMSGWSEPLMGLFMIAPTLAQNDLMLADAQGRVVLDFDRTSLGKTLPTEALALGLALEWQGQRVGTLVNGYALHRATALTQGFLGAIGRGILLAGLAAGAVALLLGTLLVRQLSGPLRSLTRAAERIAQGDLDQQVPEASTDELRRLARAFNRMSIRLQEAQERRRRAEALRRQMLADTAHELRTPIAVLRGDLEAMLDGIVRPDEGTLRSMEEEMRRLTRLVEDLHELALLEAGELRLEPRPTRLDELARQVVEAARAYAQRRGVHLRAQLEPVPALEADPDRLAQVLHNLLSNALRYTPAGGEVTVRVAREPAGVRCEVSDSGPGLSSEELELVFERLWRSDKARDRDRGGSGLGLAIAKKLVEAHGGRLTVRSAPGQGSTFGFLLGERGLTRAG